MATKSRITTNLGCRLVLFPCDNRRGCNSSLHDPRNWAVCQTSQCIRIRKNVCLVGLPPRLERWRRAAVPKILGRNPKLCAGLGLRNAAPLNDIRRSAG
jgi:hypothetical protein